MIDIKFKFNTKYKGRLLNNIKESLSQFFLRFFCAILCLFVALYKFISDSKHVMTKFDSFIIYTLIIVSIILIISSLFVLFFTRCNKHLKGVVEFIIKENDGNYHYTLCGVKYNKYYKEEGIVNNLYQKSSYFILRSDQNTEYLIPFSVINKDVMNHLVELTSIIKNKNTKKD